MCGIAGVLGPLAQAPRGLDDARRMVAALAHRGPDGLRVEALPGAALAHARLSVIDVDGGWQPLHAAGSTVVGNGEIYNYRELAAEFGLAGKLNTGSDFEPMLHIYAQEGPRVFARLRGMYAFCLVGGDGRTWLVRDPFGIKPLHVREPADGVRFASEPAALDPPGLPRALGERRAGQLLSLGYLVDDRRRPLTRGVPPGAVVECVAARPTLREVIAPLPAAPGSPPPRDEAQAIARLDAVLEDSVRVHQRSDVPYGLFLSGGVDSGVLATMMARLNSRPVIAFTCGFDVAGAADERRAAERVARALDLDWRETRFAAEDFRRIAPHVAAALDAPTTDYACLPTWKLAEAARGALTVVLSGEGGDELFAGYGRYRRALRPRWLGGRPAEPRIDAPFLDETVRRQAMAAWREAALHGAPPNASRLQRAQWADIATWLPADLLLKLDRMLMAHGLEGRTPFLDREVAAFAWSLPDRWKVRGRWGKYLLRRWLERECPSAAPWARKQGFTTPVDAWIAPDAVAIGARVAARPAVRALCDVEAVRAVFAHRAQSRNWWPLVFYALWSTIHEEGASPDEARDVVLGAG